MISSLTLTGQWEREDGKMGSSEIKTSVIAPFLNSNKGF